MNEKLKLCPFCGGRAILNKKSRLGNGGCDLYEWQIGCGSCGAQIPSTGDKAIRDDDGIRLTQDGKKDAVEKWNKRPDISIAE